MALTNWLKTTGSLRYEQDSVDYLAIDFTDLSYYEPTSWEWDFGDGSTSTEQYPSHRYAADDADETIELRHISLFP